MTKSLVLAGMLALGAAALPSAANAVIINVSLGASAEIFTLFGQGAIAPGVGSFKIAQGSSTFDGTNSIFTLTGTITGGSAGYNSGTYSFVTTYAGANTPQAGPNAPLGQSNPSNLNQFFYNSLSPSTRMTLNLFTPGGTFSQVLFNGTTFPNSANFGFLFTSPTCTGVASCTQNNVGLTPGATISGPVTISASFDVPVVAPGIPEPATWAMMLTGFGVAGAALRRSKARARGGLSHA